MFSKVGSSSVTLGDDFKCELESARVLRLSYKGISSEISCDPRFEYKYDDASKALSLQSVLEESKISSRDKRKIRSLAGTNLRLLRNMVAGMKSPFSSTVNLEGVGFKVAMAPSKEFLIFDLGFSHPVLVSIPKQISLELLSQSKIVVRSASKGVLGDFCAILSGRLRSRDPYHNKGIMVAGEKLVTKEIKKK